jgi:galactofuranosylgalactofuranosylrhamnosyl-N-acetylglucosaminyl-diphospho-decaprenol beta-1,5/1,6-galactofuranosyltransferase
MPFFIKLDDIEFGLRIKEKLGNPIVAFPGIAVWHEPFYAKNPVWDQYYWFRNHLITHSLRNSLAYLDAVKFATRALLLRLFVFDYNTAEMIVRGFEDYMQGPLFIEKNDPEVLHASVVGMSKTYKSQSVQPASLVEQQTSPNLTDEETKKLANNRILGMLTLNGHLLPNFLLNDANASFMISPKNVDWWPKVFTKKQVLFFRENTTSVTKHEMNRTAAFGILIRWSQLVIKSSTRWSGVSAEWRQSFSRLTSTEFWKNYLKLDEALEVK